MPRGLSQTCLPAAAVCMACDSAMAALRLERAEVRTTVENDWLKDHIYLSRSRMLKKLPEYMVKLWEQHRKDDEAVLMALRALCAAATALSQEFTVEMTADDFRLLAAYYTPAEKALQAN